MIKLSKKDIAYVSGIGFIILASINIVSRIMRGLSFGESIIQFLNGFRDLDFVLASLLFFFVFWIMYILFKLLYLFMKRFGFKFLLNNRYKVLSVFILLLISIFSLILYDMHELRGYYYNQFFARNLHLSDTTKFADIEYKIKKNSDNTWNITFKNNDFSYYQFLLYRNGEKDFILTDSILVNYALRKNVTIKTKTYNDGYFFGCGTGLETVFIRPYEEFYVEKYDIFESFSGEDFIFWYDRLIKSEKVMLEFYLPLFQIGSLEPFYAKSNSIELDSDELLTLLKKKFKKIPELHKKVLIENAHKFNVPNKIF